jgi:hypothetical protein
MDPRQTATQIVDLSKKIGRLEAIIETEVAESARAVRAKYAPVLNKLEQDLALALGAVLGTGPETLPASVDLDVPTLPTDSRLRIMKIFADHAIHDLGEATAAVYGEAFRHSAIARGRISAKIQAMAAKAGIARLGQGRYRLASPGEGRIGSPLRQ